MTGEKPLITVLKQIHASPDCDPIALTKNKSFLKSQLRIYHEIRNAKTPIVFMEGFTDTFQAKEIRPKIFDSNQELMARVIRKHQEIKHSRVRNLSFQDKWFLATLNAPIFLIKLGFLDELLPLEDPEAFEKAKETHKFAVSNTTKFDFYKWDHDVIFNRDQASSRLIDSTLKNMDPATLLNRDIFVVLGASHEIELELRSYGYKVRVVDTSSIWGKIVRPMRQFHSRMLKKVFNRAIES